jgi:hypothetical protein
MKSKDDSMQKIMAQISKKHQERIYQALFRIQVDLKKEKVLLVQEEKNIVMELAEKYCYKETSNSTEPDSYQRYQESLKTDRLNKLYHQESGSYNFLRIRPPKDKRLRQIDKSLCRFLLLLLQIYSPEPIPNRKQKQFAFLFRKRKGRQRGRVRGNSLPNSVFGSARV